MPTSRLSKRLQGAGRNAFLVISSAPPSYPHADATAIPGRDWPYPRRSAPMAACAKSPNSSPSTRSTRWTPGEPESGAFQARAGRPSEFSGLREAPSPAAAANPGSQSQVARPRGRRADACAVTTRLAASMGRMVRRPPPVAGRRARLAAFRFPAACGRPLCGSFDPPRAPQCGAVALTTGTR